MSELTEKPAVPSGSSANALPTIMRCEWRTLKADRITQTVVLLFAALVACALINGFAAYSRQQRKADEGSREQRALYEKTGREIAQAERERLDKGESLDLLKSGVPSASAVYNKVTNFKATLPFDAGAALNAGQSDSRPLTFAYKTGGRFTPFFPTVGTRSLGGLFPETSTDNPLLTLLGQFDLAFVTLYIYPLVILVLGFNMVTADRESGILALALSQPVSLRTVILGKVAVRALLVFSVGVVLPVVIAQVIAHFGYGNAPSGRMFSTSGLWMAAAILYGVFWFALVLLINAVGQSTAANAVISIVCWIAFVILIPALVNLSIQLFLPSPSHFRFVTAEREASLELNSRFDAALASLNQLVRERYPLTPGDKAAQVRYNKGYFGEPVRLPRGGELLGDFIEDHPEWSQAVTPDQIARALLEIRRTRMEERLAKVLEQANARRGQQEASLSVLRFASPTILMQSALNDITGTGEERYKNFIAQLDNYIRERESFFSAKILKRENINSRELDHLPAFSYREESLSRMVKRLIVPLAALPFLSTVLLFSALRSYRRYSVLG